MDIDAAPRISARPSTGFAGSVPDLVAEIDVAGCACLPDAVDEGWIDRVRSYAATLPADRHDIMIEGAGAAQLGFIRELTSDPALGELAESIARLACPDADPADRQFDCALRAVSGPAPHRRPLWLHYDASVLTVVLPVDVPDAAPGRSGELVLFPNHRPYRRWVLTNVLEKFIRQSDGYRRRFQRRARWGVDTEVVAMTPGNAYLFWGYRSYHATLPCAPGTRRVTVVLHYKDVHAGSRFLRFAKAVRALPGR
ncbi:hypothetical protein [Mycolicibacterium diernhoferi]|nr:hypothetical protein [Mycolicibacterium diernhoferi]OJZ66922.1 hypothetical protein BRW64_06620 [Mycolicibacterium diernhoferi]OPE55624.1 hypothetical protein BV510_04035 [Mycolicibacterium diernhoferi]QYL23113.1 hypothetical protein K0O62_01785 [Mycolicibacterium diernhoferi]